jgi:hypothetical protein
MGRQKFLNSVAGSEFICYQLILESSFNLQPYFQLFKLPLFKGFIGVLL